MTCFSNKIKNNCGLFIMGVSFLIGLFAIIIALVGVIAMGGGKYDVPEEVGDVKLDFAG